MSNDQEPKKIYQLVSLNDIKDRIKKADMLFQISCYDLSWNEAKKIIKELICYPLENYPSDIMILKGWNGILSKKSQLEADSNEDQKGFLKKLIKIAEMDAEFASEQKKIDSESAIFILSFLKSLFKKTLSLIKALGKVPKSITLPNPLNDEELPLAFLSKNREDENEPFANTAEEDNQIESEDSTSNPENNDEDLVREPINFGLEIFYYDEIRGPVSLQTIGIELDKSVRDSIKNLMDQKSGTITLMMNDWVMVNEIKEYVPSNLENPPRMFHLLIYWKNSENPTLYEDIAAIESRISLFLQDLFQNPKIDMENIKELKTGAFELMKNEMMEFLKGLSKIDEKLNDIDSEQIANPQQLEAKPIQKLSEPPQTQRLQSKSQRVSAQSQQLQPQSQSQSQRVSVQSQQLQPQSQSQSQRVSAQSQQLQPQSQSQSQRVSAQSQQLQSQIIDNKQHSRNDRRIQQEINELDKIINQGVFSDEEKILLRVLDVVSALNNNNPKKSV